MIVQNKHLCVWCVIDRGGDVPHGGKRDGRAESDPVSGSTRSRRTHHLSSRRVTRLQRCLDPTQPTACSVPVPPSPAPLSPKLPTELPPPTTTANTTHTATSSSSPSTPNPPSAILRSAVPQTQTPPKCPRCPCQRPGGRQEAVPALGASPTSPVASSTPDRQKSRPGATSTTNACDPEDPAPASGNANLQHGGTCHGEAGSPETRRQS